jgi:hypothetical protein
MLVRGIGIRDISAVLRISITKVLKALKSAHYSIKPKFSHYDCLETDGFWTYVGKKKNKAWLIYAYHRGCGKIAAYVWGKRDIKTAQKLRKRLKRLGISYDRIATDNLGKLSAGVRGGEARSREGAYGGDRGEQLPAEV